MTSQLPQDECARYARQYVDEHRLTSTLSAFPTNLFDIDRSKEGDILWNEQDWSAYYDASVANDIRVSTPAFRDAIPFYLGQVAGDRNRTITG